MSNEEVLKYAEELINKNQYAIVGTINKSFPNIRALKVMKKNGIKILYFSTKKTSEKVKQMKKNKKGCLFFYDTTNYSSVMLEGTFEIKDNVIFDVSKFFDLHPEPYDFCNIIFNTTKVYVYLQYKGYEIKI